MPDLVVRSLLSLTRRLAVERGTDTELLDRFTLANDPNAFAELVRRHGPMVFGVCRRMLGHVHDAEDAFQATFLIFTRSARSVRKPDALSAWLFGTALRVCRKARARRGNPGNVPDRAAIGDDPYAEVAWKELRGLLDEEVGRMPAALRDPLVLCYFDGLSRDEAAERLGWSRRTLMRRLEKARERLRLRLKRHGVGSLGLGVAALSPRGLVALAPDRLVKATLGLVSGGPVPASVQVLAGGTAFKLFAIVAGVALLLAGGGIGLAVLASQPTEDPPAAPKATVEKPPTRENAPLLDGDGRALPDGAILRLGSRRFRAEGHNDLALPTPDGKYVLIHPQPSLSAYAAQGLMLVDLETGLRVRSFEQSHRVAKCGSYEAIRPAVFSPDGKKLYALGWDKSEEKGERFYVWANTDNPCKRVLLVWDVDTGKLTDEWELPAGDRHGASLIGLNVSPDGKRLYVYGAVRMNAIPGQTIKGVPGLHVVDASNGKALQTWDDAGNPAGFAAGAKELITFRRDAPITAYDVETGKTLRTFELNGLITSVVLTADGKTMAGVGIKKPPDKSIACELKLWDTKSGKEIRTLPVDGKEVSSFSAHLAFAEDGKTLYLGAGSGRILAWDLTTNEQRANWLGHDGMIHDMCMRPGKNELVSAGSWDGAIRRWDAATGKNLSMTDAYVGEFSVALMPDRREVAICDATGRLDIWNLATGRIARTIQLPADRRREIMVSPDGKSLIDATDDLKIAVRDSATGKAVGEIPPPERQNQMSSGWSMKFSPDGKSLITTRHGFGTRLITWPECKVAWQSPDTFEAVFSPDSERMVCGDWHQKSFLCDPKSGNVLSQLEGEGMTSGAFSPDGRRVVTSHLAAGRGIPIDPEGGAWRVRDGTSGRVLKVVKGFQYVWDVAFSPSGWLLAVAGDNSVRVYDTASWQEVEHFDGHEGTVRSVFFGADDATLVSASAEDGTALVWSLKPPAGRELPDPVKVWAGLAGDGPAIRRAVWAAAQHPDVAVKLFREKWPILAKPINAERVRKLIDKLDSGDFEVREAAEAELARLGRLVEDDLRKVVADTKSAEVKERAGRVLAKLSPTDAAEYPADEARELRAVWALELAGTAEAKKLLEAWTMAKAGNRLNEASAAALKRMRGKEK